MTESPKKFKFEDKIDVIDAQLAKARHRWHLRAMPSIDYDDVSQIIRLHIFKKWHLWDQRRSLEPWIAMVISSQMKNLLRNLYYSVSRPCLKCEHNLHSSSSKIGEDVDSGCGLTKSGKQCSECLLYKNWECRKKAAHDIRMPVSYDSCEDVFRGIDETPNEDQDINKESLVLHERMLTVLSPVDAAIYRVLIINSLPEKEGAKFMAEKLGLKGNAAKKSVIDYTERFRDMAKRLLRSED